MTLRLSYTRDVSFMTYNASFVRHYILLSVYYVYSMMTSAATIFDYFTSFRLINVSFSWEEEKPVVVLVPVFMVNELADS